MIKTNKLDNLVGRKFGHWTVLSKASFVSGGNSYWNCLCGKCKKIFPTQRTGLISGESRQCRECANKPRYVGNIYVHYYHTTQTEAIKHKRQKAFAVSIEYLDSIWKKQDGKCALSGIPIAFQDLGKAKGTASLDRIDSNKGYIKGNVQWLHKDVNIMKNSFSDKKVLELCKLIVDYAEENKKKWAIPATRSGSTDSKV